MKQNEGINERERECERKVVGKCTVLANILAGFWRKQ